MDWIPLLTLQLRTHCSLIWPPTYFNENFYTKKSPYTSTLYAITNATNANKKWIQFLIVVFLWGLQRWIRAPRGQRYSHNYPPWHGGKRVNLCESEWVPVMPRSWSRKYAAATERTAGHISKRVGRRKGEGAEKPYEKKRRYKSMMQWHSPTSAGFPFSSRRAKKKKSEVREGKARGGI